MTIVASFVDFLRRRIIFVKMFAYNGTMMVHTVKVILIMFLRKIT